MQTNSVEERFRGVAGHGGNSYLLPLCLEVSTSGRFTLTFSNKLFTNKRHFRWVQMEVQQTQAPSQNPNAQTNGSCMFQKGCECVLKVCDNINILSWFDSIESL